MVKIVYVGKDELFFRKLEERLKSENSKDLTIESIDPENKTITSIFSKVCIGGYQIIYMDFSFQPDKIKHLTWDLRVSPDTKNCIITGLLNALDTQDSGKTSSLIEHALITQPHFIHSKGAEITDTIADPFYLLNQSTDYQGKYASYNKLDKEVIASTLCKLSHITEDAIIIESRALFPKGEKYQLQTVGLESLNNHHFPLTNHDRTLLRLPYATRMKFAIPFMEDDDIHRPVEKKKYHDTFQGLRDHFKTHRVRILIIQRDLSILQQEGENFANLDFIIRCKKVFDDDTSIISNLRPNIVVFSMEEGPQEDEQKQKKDEEKVYYNSSEGLERLINQIKVIPDYNPIIKVFDSKSTTEAFQDAYGYNFILSSTNSPSLELVLQMANLFEERQAGKAMIKSDPLIENVQNCVRIPSLDLRSVLLLETPIVIKSLSEHEIEFYCEVELPHKTILQIEEPQKLLITVGPVTIELEKKQGFFGHYGLIHGLNEVQRIALRKHVNQLFFTEHETKKQEEKEAFLQKNKEALHKKTEAQEQAKKQSESQEENQDNKTKEDTNEE